MRYVYQLQEKELKLASYPFITSAAAGIFLLHEIVCKNFKYALSFSRLLNFHENDSLCIKLTEDQVLATEFTLLLIIFK